MKFPCQNYKRPNSPLKFSLVFNEINARKLERDEINVFAGIFNNCLFWFIIIVTIVVQYGMILFGGAYVGIAPLTQF